ncbi:nuclear factor I C [Rhinolophus ferrumequinum]|uniref:Nuclear factor I C n=1 Tax=Rhinolophus ferrumequinum TaxID=59479 RepID=A0A7J7U1R1_RHIFE|nr:nuclear factor I C [Rhinolophus ferrumequinum]
MTAPSLSPQGSPGALIHPQPCTSPRPPSCPRRPPPTSHIRLSATHLTSIHRTHSKISSRWLVTQPASNLDRLLYARHVPCKPFLCGIRTKGSSGHLSGTVLVSGIRKISAHALLLRPGGGHTAGPRPMFSVES